MSRTPTADIVERFLDALSQGDDETALACLSENVVRDMEGGGRELGREKFRWYLGLRRRHFRETLADLVIMENGVHAAAELTCRGTYEAAPEGWPPASGQHYTLPAGLFFEVDESLITRVTLYRDVEAWKSALSRG